MSFVPWRLYEKVFSITENKWYSNAYSGLFKTQEGYLRNLLNPLRAELFCFIYFFLFLDTQIVQVVEALLLLEAVYPTWTPWLLMTWWHIGSQNISRNYIDRVIQLANDAITTSLWRQNDVATSFRRHNDVIIASCVRWHALQTDIVKSRSRDIWSYPIEICQAVEKPVIFKVVIVVSFISNRIQQWNNTRKKNKLCRYQQTYLFQTSQCLFVRHASGHMTQ